MTKIAFNLATLAVAATAAMHVKDPAGNALFADKEGKLPVRILFHSPGSHAFAAVEGRQTARAVKRMNDNEGKVTAGTPEERRIETAEDLAAVTAGFENAEFGDGSLQGEDLYLAVYSDPKLGFIVKQATKFLADWGNFKAGSVPA